MNQSELHDGGSFKIGAVSRLTGLSAHTLRKWETRYNAVEPQRTERGQRLYSRDEVERLLLIKKLVDGGTSPRDVARLGLAQLTEQLEQLTDVELVAGSARTAFVRVVAVGSGVLAMLEESSAAASVLEVVARAHTESSLDFKAGEGSVDLLVYECPTVNGESHATVDALMTRIGAAAAVIVYRYATRGDLLSLQSPKTASLRAPAELKTLEQIALNLVHPAVRANSGQHQPEHMLADVPAPRLSREAITRMARITPRIQCECPKHLADILLGLRAFEDYSEACENLNPGDAALHHYLWRSAAQARALFEDAIERVAAAENISLRDA